MVVAFGDVNRKILSVFVGIDWLLWVVYVRITAFGCIVGILCDWWIFCECGVRFDLV